MDDESQEEKPAAFRQRSPAFSKLEVKTLISLIEKYKIVVLNKSTSASASHAKEIIWTKIAKKFNRKGYKHTRSADCLKIKWENLKKEARKVTKNLIDTKSNNEVLQPIVMMMCKSDVNISNIELPEDLSDDDMNESIDEKLSNTDKYWDENAEKQSDDSLGDGRQSQTNNEAESIDGILGQALEELSNKYDSDRLHVNVMKETQSSDILEVGGLESCKNIEFEFLDEMDEASSSFTQEDASENDTDPKDNFTWQGWTPDSLKRLIAGALNTDSRRLKKGRPQYENLSEQLMKEKMKLVQTLIKNAEEESKMRIQILGEQLKENGDEKDSEEKDAGAEEKDGRTSNRSLNFSPQECSILLRCVREEKKYIFLKDNTLKSSKLKNLAWDRVTEAFNKHSPQKRSNKMLRNKFNNMKKMAKRVSFKDYLKDVNKKHEKLVEETNSREIKPEPNDNCRVDVEVSDDDDFDDNDEIQDSASNHNDTAPDPLCTVLNGDSGIGSLHGDPWNAAENKEVTMLKIQLLNYQLENAKLERKRIEDAILADTAANEARAIETSLLLRKARLETIAAETKFPSTHPSLHYTPEEVRGQEYINQSQQYASKYLDMDMHRRDRLQADNSLDQ